MPSRLARSAASLRHGLDRVLALAAMAAMSLLLLCVLLGVVTRAIGDPLIWTDEVSRFLMVWLAVLGWLLASRRQSHIRIRYFVGLLPASARGIVEVGTQIAVALFGGLAAAYSVTLVTRNMDIEATTVPVAMSFLYLPVVLAGGVTALQAIGEAWAAWRGPPGEPPPASIAGSVE